MVFKPKYTDYELSPYTGLTRESWIEAAEYLLGGIFGNIKDSEDPVVMPRYETEVTYPSKDAPEWRIKAEYFEGLCRSFFISAPLIHIEPELTLNGINVRDYYKKQVLYAVTPGEKNYVLNYSDMRALDESDNPSACYQQTVETAALVICLWLCQEEIWDTYTREEKDRRFRMLKIAKQCGCKFYLGSDAHNPVAFDKALLRFNGAVDELGLEESDKFNFGSIRRV